MSKVFADATSRYLDADFVLFGAPFDGTSCFRRGSRLAPDAMREASYNFETYNKFFDIDLADLRIHDAGNIEVSSDIRITLNTLTKKVGKIAWDKKVPVMLGGEHSLTYACVKACLKKNLGILILDAHLDMREEYEGEKYSHACVSRNIIEELTRNYATLGIRSGTKEEYTYAEEHGIACFSSDEVEARGVEAVLEEALDMLKCSQVYLSIDADVIDPAYAPALGTPEPFGITPREVRTIIRRLAPFAIGFDLVEITPEYDSGGTALLGAKLVREFIAAKALNPR
jgi:agmatinase